MSDMKKWMQITEGAIQKEEKQDLTESCEHDMPCACNSYLCEDCYPAKPVTKLELPEEPAEDDSAMANDDGQLSTLSLSAGISEDDEDFDDAEAGDSSAEFAGNDDVMVDLGEPDDFDAEPQVDPAAINPEKEMGKAVQGHAPENVDDLMAAIMDMQTMGMSQAKIDYSDDMLINMSPERIKKVYAKVMGEALEEAFEGDEIEEILAQHNIKTWDDYDASQEAQDHFYDHFSNNGEMPYGAVTGDDMDPQEWIGDKLADYIDEDGVRDFDHEDHNFEQEVRRLWQQTAMLDGSAEIVAKKMGVDVEKVRRVLDEQKVVEAELQRLKDLVKF
jgi:hypothetical protein